MPAGRKPLPTALKLITGADKQNPHRINKAEPKPAQSARVPSPPAHLDRIAHNEWRRVAKDLHRTGILTKVDHKILAAYCQAFSDWQAAQGRLAKYNMENPEHPNVQKTLAGTFIHHPWVPQLRDARRDMLRFAVELGITPSARSRVRAVSDDDGNEFANF